MAELAAAGGRGRRRGWRTPSGCHGCGRSAGRGRLGPHVAGPQLRGRPGGAGRRPRVTLAATAHVSLTAHMVQHVLLLVVAAPLAGHRRAAAHPAVGPTRPPAAVGRTGCGGRALRGHARRWATVGRPPPCWPRAWSCWPGTRPVLYEAALGHGALHVLQHASYLVTATVFWWAVGLGSMRTARRRRPGAVRRRPARHRAGRRPHARRHALVRAYPSLSDQQLAGVVMWGFAGLAYVLAAACLFGLWLAAWSVRRRPGPGAGGHDGRQPDDRPGCSGGSTPGCTSPTSPAARCTRSSRTTGRSCWARSPSTASWSWSLTGTYLTFFFSPSAKDGRLRRQLRPAAGAAHVGGLPLDACASASTSGPAWCSARCTTGPPSSSRAPSSPTCCRVFFTGAFRRPRELNWIIGVTLLALAIFNGFSGYSLPDDLLSGTGLRIAYSIALAVPVIGTWAAFLRLRRRVPVARHHLPAVRAPRPVRARPSSPGCSAAHLAILWRQKHTQFPGPGRTEDNIVGSRLWPTYAARSDRPVGRRVRDHRRPRRAGPDQPHLALRPVRAVGGDHRLPARLVHGLDGGGAAALPGLAHRPVRLHDLGAVLAGGGAARASPSGCSTCGRSSNAGSPATPPSTTCSTGPGTGRCAPPSGSAPSRSTSSCSSPGRSDIGAQKFGVAIPTFTRVLQVLVVVLPVVAALIAWKVCQGPVGCRRPRGHQGGDQALPNPYHRRGRAAGVARAPPAGRSPPHGDARLDGAS